MKKRTFISCLVLCVGTQLIAQNSQVLREKAKLAEAYQSADQVLLSDSTSVTVSPAGSGTFSIYKATLINSQRGGLDNRVIVYDYDPLTASAKFDYVKIHKANGEVKTLDITKVCDYTAPARMIYWGAKQIMLEVGQLNKGDILEYQIAKKGFTYALLAENGQASYGGGSNGTPSNDEDRFVPPMKGEFYDIIPFWCTHPTLRKVYRVSLPQEKELQYQFYQGECHTRVANKNGHNIYTFSVNNVTPFRKEPNMVDLFDAAPKLMMSTTPEWKDKSLWFNQTNETYGSFHAFAPAQKKVDEIIQGKEGEMEKIAALTHWVADNIRYSGITMGKGEGFTLHSTKMNYTDRCGVCKDIASSLISFLRMAGFEAYPAMTMAGSRVEAIPADHFNHCVAVVRLSNGTYIPLDPTWVPFCREIWSSAEQQQNYLPGIPEGSDLCITPVSAPENHYFRMKADNQLDAQGTLRGKMTVTAEGQSDSQIRRIFTNGWQTDWKSYIENQLIAVSPKARVTAMNWGENPKDYQAAPIKIELEYTIPDYAIVTNDEIFLQPLTMRDVFKSVRSYDRINTHADVKKYGFKDRCSRLVELDESIEIPAGMKLQSGKSDKKHSAAADFDGFIKNENNVITIHQMLALKKRIYEAEDWPGFREAVNTHRTYGEYLILHK